MTIISNKVRALILASVASVGSAGIAHASIIFDTVALSGPTGAALGFGPNLGSGVNFSSFSSPILNASGKVAFTGTVSGTGVDTANDGGLWSNAGGTLAVLAREGPAGPGPNVGAGVDFQSPGISFPLLNASGNVAFVGTLTGTGVTTLNSTGIWSNAGGTLAAVARNGSGGPGPNVGAGVDFLGIALPVLNNSGKVAFQASVTGTGVTTSNNSGIWSNVGGTLTTVARKGGGGPGPNVGAGVSFSGLNSSVVLNASGEVAFVGAVTGTGVTTANDSGIWTNVGGTLAVVAREGSGGPGPNVGAGVNFAGFGNPVLNNSGKVAFQATLTGTGVTTSNDSGIWSNTAGTLAAVAREGSDGPGPNVGAGVDFASFTNPVLNAAGKVAFAGTLTGTGVTTSNDSGIWSNAGGTLAAVAREGGDGPGPNVGPGVNFAEFLFTPFFNASGAVAFLGNLTGAGVTISNDVGIWSNAGGTLTNIVREGDLFDVDPSAGVDLREILGISFQGSSGGEDGRALGFNDAGLMTFSLSFTDGSSGVFTAQVPEPSTTLSTLTGIGLLALRRRR